MAESTPIYVDSDLITRVRNLTGVSSDAVEDDDIAFYFTKSDNLILLNSGKEFVATTISETRDGNGTSTIFLNHSPIITITSITMDGVEIDSDNFVFYGDTGKVTLTKPIELSELGVVASPIFTNTDKQNVTIIYTYGDVNNYQNMQDLSFYMTCKKVLWASGASESGGATSEKMADYSINYAGGSPYSGLIMMIDSEIKTYSKFLGLDAMIFGVC